MALTRIDSYLVDLDSLGGITFDDQAGTPTFKVDATTHRVGIGTASPLTPLDVRGVAYFADNVGIGTTNPQAKLDVRGTIQSPNYSPNVATNSVPEFYQFGEAWVTTFNKGWTVGINDIKEILEIKHAGGANSRVIIELYLPINNSISTGGNAGYARMRLWMTRNNGGNFRWGWTEIENYALSYVSGFTIPIVNLTADGVIIGLSSNSSSSSARVTSGTLTMKVYGDANILQVNVLDAQNLTLEKSYGWKKNNNHSHTLQGGNLYSLGERIYIGGDTNNAIINSKFSARINIDYDGDGTNEYFSIGTGQQNIDNNNELLRVTQAGNVGIGTTNPGAKLEVVGNIKIETSPGLHSETAWYSIDDAKNHVTQTDYNEVYIQKQSSNANYDNFVLYPEEVGTNFDVSFRIQGSSPNSLYRHVGIAMRSDGTDNYTDYDYIVFRYRPSNTGLNQIRIDVAGTSEGSLESSSVPNFWDGTIRHVIIRCRGRKYEIEVDGVLEHTIYASTITNPRGKIGFAIYEAADSSTWLKIKDFHITNYPEWEDSIAISGSSANVGIGTTNPIDKLHVEGMIRSDGIRPNSTYLSPTIPFRISGSVLDSNGATSTISFSINNTGASFGSYIMYVYWFGGNTGTAVQPSIVSFSIRNGGAGPNGHISVINGNTTASETYNSSTNAFDITLNSPSGTYPYGGGTIFQTV